MNQTDKKRFDSHLKRVESEDTPDARAAVAKELLKKEKSAEVVRLLKHVVKYSEQEAADQAFGAFIEKHLKANRIKSVSPEDISRLRTDFEHTRSKRVRRRK